MSEHPLEPRLAEARKNLADQFDHGIMIVSWEEEGQTMYLETQFGNGFACEKLAERAVELLFPDDEDEDEIEIELD